MRDALFFNAVRVLLLVAALLAIGSGINRVVVERSAPAPTPAAPVAPADTGKLTTEQRQTLLRTLQEQLDAMRAAQARELAFRARRRTADLVLMGASFSLAVLAPLFGYLLRRRAGAASARRDGLA